MKTILFPTDFSPIAHNAYRYALQLANRLDAQIVTLHIYKSPNVDAPHVSHTLSKIRAMQKQEELAQYEKAAEIMHIQAVDEKSDSVQVIHLFREDDNIVEGIIDASREQKATFIVMGTEGASGLEEMFVGSITAKVMAEAMTPVLAIPENASYKPIQQVVYATNFDNTAAAHISKVANFARLFDAKIKVVHVNDDSDSGAYEKMGTLAAQLATNPQISDYEVLEETDILATLDAYVENNSIDMLAMLTHKRNFLQRLFSISYTQKMAFQTDVPLLALQDDD